MALRAWNVRLIRDGWTLHLGQVDESSEPHARCAALSRFGVTEEETAEGPHLKDANLIYPDEDFDVTPAD